MRQFKADVAKRQKKELDEIIGANDKQGRAKLSKVNVKSAERPQKGEPQLGPYVSSRFIIRAKYKGYYYTAKVHQDGTIVYNGTKYTSPSRAGIAVNKRRSVNGWTFWKYKNYNGEWVYINELRKGKKKSIVKGKNKPRDKAKKPRKTSSLAPYVNERLKIFADYKGKRHWANVRKDGTINYQGKIFTSPSVAGRAVTGRATGGWTFWKYQNAKNEWVPLDMLRKK